MLKEADDVIPE